MTHYFSARRDFHTRLATGKLLAVDNQVDATTGTVKLKAVFPNEDNLLFPNQFVNARLLVDTKHDATIVPAAAVQRGPDATFVYVLQADSTVERRNVEVGPLQGDQAAIETGLKPHEVVVTDGIDKLQNGSKVAARSAAGKGFAGKASTAKSAVEEKQSTPAPAASAPKELADRSATPGP